MTERSEKAQEKVEERKSVHPFFFGFYLRDVLFSLPLTILFCLVRSTFFSNEPLWVSIVFQVGLFVFLMAVTEQFLPHLQYQRSEMQKAIKWGMLSFCIVGPFVWIIRVQIPTETFVATILVSGCIPAYVVLQLVTKSNQMLKERADLALRLKKLEEVVTDLGTAQSARLDKMLKSHALFTENNKFEKILGWLEIETHAGIKWLIARMISHQLSNAFRDGDRIVLRQQSYTDHSIIFSELVDQARDICLTCIRSPVEWFGELSKAPSDTLQDTTDLLIRKLLSPEELTKVTDDRKLKYPMHFIKFLKPTSGKRRRVFLLSEESDARGESEWAKLLDNRNVAYFLKFIVPCYYRKIRTRFVNIEELVSHLSVFSTPEQDIIRVARRENMFKTDYNIFNDQAIMVFTPSDFDINQQKDEIVFKVTDVEPYIKFIDFIFSITEHGRGVYTEEEIASLLGYNLQEVFP